MKHEQKLKQALQELDALKEKVQGLIKPELKVGRWYKGEDEYLVCVTEILEEGMNYVLVYGFDKNGAWFNNWDTVILKSRREATEQEVEDALVKEAERRGFLTRGVFFKSFSDNGKVREVQPFECYDGTFNPIELSFNGNYLYYKEGLKCSYDLCSNPRVFEDGKWAEIVEQPVDKFAELKEAHSNGAVIQYKNWTTKYFLDCPDNLPKWDERTEYRIKPEEKPKVGDVVKAWYNDESDFLIGYLNRIDSGTNFFPFVVSNNGFKNAKPLTKQEAIELLFGKQTLADDIQELKDKHPNLRFTITVEDNV